MTFGAMDQEYRGTRLYRVIRFVVLTVTVLGALAIGAVALILHAWADARDEAQHKADATVQQSAERYTSALQRVFGDGTGTTGDVLAATRGAYVSSAGSAVAQGISPTGVRNAGADVTVDFTVSATYGGGFNQALSSECFRVTLHRNHAGEVGASRRSIECRAVRPVTTSRTTFRVR